MKAKIAFTFKLIFSALIFLGILDRAGIFTQSLQLHTLYSFTTISNACVMIVVLYAAFRCRLSFENLDSRFARLQYLCLIMILITGTVHHFVLFPQKVAENPAYQVFTFGNIVAHYIAPIGMLADWLLFEQKGLLSKREPLICVSVPFLYFIFASMYGYYGSTIPGKDTSYIYFFMDFGKLGITGVIAWVSAILVFVLFLAYSVFAVDCIMARRTKEKSGNLIDCN